MPLTPITKHVFLDHCWVCKTPFDSSTKEHRHHLIPQAYGGVDGPQVSLCDSHHSALHEIALRLYTGKPYYQLVTRDPDKDERLLYLAQVAYNARLATENDPHKKKVIVLSLTGETFLRLKKLKGVYPKLSQQSLVVASINMLYNKHFQE